MVDIYSEGREGGQEGEWGDKEVNNQARGSERDQ